MIMSSKTYRRTKLCFPIFAFFLIVIYSTLVLNTYIFPLLRSLDEKSRQCTDDRQLRVYLYDLPKRFNVGMFNHKKSPFLDNDTGSSLPMWPSGMDGIKKQHSMEYWIMASLFYDGGDGDLDAVRVTDPDMADVFFVPYFSAMSFFTLGFNSTDRDNVEDKRLQLELMEILHGSKYWQRSGGRDHVVPVTLPKGFSYTGHQLNASIFVVVDFGRHPQNISNLHKDVVSPYVHIIDSFLDDDSPNPFESRRFLLFFRGLTVRENEGKIRTKLAQILSGYRDVRFFESIPSTDTISLATREMQASKFCLSPAGNTPSSCRLFDAIVSHCVPVIVSDHIELPFEDELNYSKFAVFFSMEEALQPNYVVKQLRQFPKEKWVEMWKELKKVSHHFEFQYPPMKEDAVSMIWRQVKRKLPSVRLAVRRSHRLKIPNWWTQ